MTPASVPNKKVRFAQLRVTSNGLDVGMLQQDQRTRRLSFVYEESWMAMEGAYPVSLSMPLVQREYVDPVVNFVVSAILPERRETLDQISRDHHVSSSDPFGLLSVLGEDCPGAMQYVPVDKARTLDTESKRKPITWLSEHELAERLRALGTREAPGRLEGDRGYFSLAGQQPKSALRFDEDNNRWGIPEGREPTTHIIKPPIGKDLRILAAEHLSMALAAQLGLTAAQTTILKAEDQIALSIARYDRVRQSNRWFRVHQEDVCQSMGISPERKYERTGGPGVTDIVRLLQSYSIAPEVDVLRFLDAIALNWIIVGTDAHARNYSMIIGAGGSARLAPLYDVSSILGLVASGRLHTVNLAMQIGGVYVASKIKREQWAQLGVDLDRDPAEVRDRVGEFVRRVPDAMAAVAEDARERRELPVEMIDDLENAIAKRAKRCVRVL